MLQTEGLKMPRPRKSMRFFFILPVALLLLAAPIRAEEKMAGRLSFSLESFKEMAIQESGRIKPLDTYARSVLLQFSGKQSFNRRPAIEWLARLLFTPEATRDDKIFLINNSDIPNALGVKPDHNRRYSFSDLNSGYHKLQGFAVAASQIDAKKKTVVESEFIRIFASLELYLKLAQSLQFAAPHDEFTITSNEVRNLLKFPPEKKDFSFIDIALKAEQLKSITDELEGKNATSWPPLEREVFRLVSGLYQWATAFGDRTLTIIPPFAGHDDAWISPWEAIAFGFLNEEIKNEVLLLNEMSVAYRAGEQAAFDIAAHRFTDSVEKRAGGLRGVRAIPLELLYSKYPFYFFAQLFYVLAMVFAAVALFSPWPFLYRLSFYSIVLGFIPHTFALLLRIVILGRPPVTSLYETFIFVSWVAVLLGILVEFIHKRWLGIAVSGICGIILLVFASKFSAEGDTMKMLVAVLNSNFWLSVHVPNITMGYAACCVAGSLGHIYIIQGLVRPSDRAQLDVTYKILMLSLGLGLMLAFFGTMLGGIWADQSWGRFWGWDPKENGALMIVLWCALILHARVAKLIGPLGIAVLSTLLLVVVMWAWFGVNILSVGLHSYGFTSGVATGFAAYAAAEALFLFLAVPIVSRKLKQTV